MQPDQIKSALSNSLPFGITITDIFSFSKKDHNLSNIANYLIIIKDYNITQESIDEFMNLSEFPVEGISKKGAKIITDLRRVVDKIKLLDLTSMEMVLKKYNEKTIRPAEILLKCLKVPQEIVQAARIVKQKQDI